MSTIPAAVDALIAMLGLVLPDVQVSDGPATQWPDEDTITVGWAADRSSVTTEVTREGLAGDHREFYDIACLISCVSGEFTFKPLRDRAFGYYDTIRAQLKKDPRLGGVVMSARPSLLDVDQELMTSETGALSAAAVDLSFLVTCDAFA